MDYLSLYRKYRPEKFSEVVGQDHVTQTLAREILDGSVAHAYLFAGPRGTGKTTSARLLAKALNCTDRGDDGEPCGTCDSCVSITEGTSFDVIELDAASHNSVDDIREMRVSATTVASVGGARRVFILDEAHMLSKAAGNALLKTLEEPPEHVHFVLATTEPYKLLDTIRSRSQRFDFHPISIDSLSDHLAVIAGLEAYTADRQALVAVARHARGSARDSLSLLEQVAALGSGTVTEALVNRALGLADRDVYGRLASSISDRDAKGVLEIISEIAALGIDLRRFAADAIGFFRGVFLAQYAPNLEDLVDEPAEVLEDWRAIGASIAKSDVIRALDLLSDALVRLREGREERLMVELAFLKLARPDVVEDTAALTSRLDVLERKLNQLEAAPPAPVATVAATEATVEPEPASAPGPTAPDAPFEDVPSAEPEAPQAVGRRPEAEGRAAASGVGVPDSGSSDAEPEPEPAAEPTSESESAQPSHQPPIDHPSMSVDLADFERVWPQLIGMLRTDLSKRQLAFLQEASPGAVDGSTIVLHLPADRQFHLEQLRRDQTASAIVARRAGELLGGAVTVAFSKADGLSEPTAPTEPEAVPDKDTLVAADDNVMDPTALLTDMLGAEVIEETSTD